jgi:FkbM family methyltransferase
VGANIGLWVMGAASIAGHDGSIHAFEPHPENYVQLRSNLALNGLEFVSCQQTALSDSPGRGLIYGASNGNCGMASLAKRDGVDEPIEVNITTLDGYCEENGIVAVDFIKVDVEGAELQVFSGAERILASRDAPVIMFEVGDAMAESFGSSSSKVKSLLGKHGYTFYRCRGKKLETTLPDEKHTQEDLFAFKAYHLERFPILNSMM